MPPTRALISFARATEDDFRQEEAKLAFLWFEGLIVENLGDFDKDKFVNSLIDETTSRRDRHLIHDLTATVEEVLGKPSIEERLAKLEHGYPRWGQNGENYDYPEPENAYDYAHNQLLRAIEIEKGVERFVDGHEIEQVEGRVRVAVDAVGLWDKVNKARSCVLQATLDEDAALKAARSFGRPSGSEALPFHLFNSSIPSLKAVPWNEIIKIKFTGAFDELRQKMSDIAVDADGDLDSARKSLDTHVQEVMDEIVEKAKPRPFLVSMLSIIGNLPFPVANPVGVYTSVRDAASEVKKKDDYNWLYMLRELKKKSSP